MLILEEAHVGMYVAIAVSRELVKKLGVYYQGYLDKMLNAVIDSFC